LTIAPPIPGDGVTSPGYRELERARQMLEQPMPILVTPQDTQDRERLIDERFRALADEIARLAAIPRRRWRARRTASAARVHPDRLAFGIVIAAINAVFVLSAMIASFSGQYALAPRTYLPPELYIMVPIALDAPIVASAFTAAVFRARKQNRAANWNWFIVTVLTLLSVTVQVTHVLEQHGFFRGLELGFPALLGVIIMGSMPVWVLVLSENLARLLVRPIGEVREASAESKTPATKRRNARPSVAASSRGRILASLPTNEGESA